jgi:hypothetical protein
MLRRVALVRTDISEDRKAFIIRMKRIGELRRALTVANNRSSLRRNSRLRLLGTVKAVPSSLILLIPMMEALRSSEISVRTRATQRNIPEGGVLNNI